jgi:hypothetical protein
MLSVYYSTLPYSWDILTQYDYLQVSTWVHYAISVKKTMINSNPYADITLFVNGIAYQATPTNAQQWPSWIQIGSWFSCCGSSGSCESLLRDLRFYNRSLSRQDVSDIMAFSATTGWRLLQATPAPIPLPYSGELGGFQQCIPCSSGQYASESGLSSCSPCPSGYISSTQASLTCKACSAGYYSDISSLTSCTACSQGTYSNESASTFCSTCPAGTYAPNASANCLGCPLGKYANASGQSTCQTCSSSCVAGKEYEAVSCTASTNRVCLPCRQPSCPMGRTPNITWCPASGFFECVLCPSDDNVEVLPNYQCTTCGNTKCGGSPGTYIKTSCPVANWSLSSNTFACGRCQGCNYRQYVNSWSLCKTGTGTQFFELDPTDATHCLPCRTSCGPGQYVTKLCNGRTMASTEVCANCTSCRYGYYHARNLTGYIHPDYDGKPRSYGYTETSCDGKGILNSDGASDCELCDTCPNGKYASSVG